MRISGFTMGKNVTKLYYPIKESILSILPICDEFIVALGKGDEDDKTREEILSIGDPRIKIVDTVWDIEKYPEGTELAHQTDIAKSYCTGDWLFYIQADEVVHEEDLPKIKKRCEELLNDNEIEGLLFRYFHFWGDYDHHIDSHGWYKNEIRIIRNDKDIHSWRDAQSFRRIPGFDEKNYRQEENTSKLKVAKVDARIFHYGWVRPLNYMQKKIKDFSEIQSKAELQKKIQLERFDYGVMSKIPVYKGTHPKLMQSWIDKLFWKDELAKVTEMPKDRKLTKHEKRKYRFITFLEKYVFFRPMWEFKNYILLKR